MVALVKLGEVCLVKRGTTITKKQTTKGKIPVIGGGTKPTYFHNQSNRDSNCITISGSGASAGFVNRWDIPIFASDCSTVEPKDETQLHKFIYYFLLSRQKFIYENFRSGAAQPHVYAKDIETLDYPIIPIAEQKLIITTIDAAFAEIDIASISHQKRVDELVNLQQVYLRKTFRNLSKDWDKVFLGDVCNLVGGGTPSKNKPEYYNGEIPWATVRDMTCEELSFTEHKITELGLKNSSSKVIPKNNLVIASRVGLGKVCILNQETAINQDLRGVIPKKGTRIDNRFLFYWFKGIADYIISEGTGLTVKGVKLPFLNSLSLPMPPIKNQQRIVSELDTIFGQSEISIKLTEKIIKEHNALKSSILSLLINKIHINGI
tara:strand:- start:140 stop:1270 length:1131 start_codon:yes stop_codon:yes gene_type:complete